MRIILLLMGLVLAAPVAGQSLPALTGRIVDQANLLPQAEEEALTAKLEALERGTSRQLVVVTVPDLQGASVEDFGYKLGETWKIGDKDADNGAILLVAVAERKIRIEVGDGLEPILTDSYAGRIIRQVITPRFKENDFPGGIAAGADAIIAQLQAPPEEAERNVLEARQEEQEQAAGSDDGGSIFPILFWGFILLFVILPMFRSGRRGRRYRRRGHDGVWIWGPGLGSGSSWGGGGGGSSWGGGGGFSGGGGSFGGGGASGGW